MFTADMQVISPNGDIWMTAGKPFPKSLKKSLANSVSRHQGLTAEIEMIDADNAQGIWAMQDVIEWKDRHPREGWKTIAGHYHETCRRENSK